MQFVVVERSRDLPEGFDGAYLVPDKWNDYGFVTLYKLRIKRRGSVSQTMGGVRIGHVEMGSGVLGEFNTTEDRLPRRFNALSEDFFSLGVDDRYYEALSTLTDGERVSVLTALRDVAYDYSQEVVDRVWDLRVFNDSLMRDVRHPQAELERLHLIAQGRDRVVTFEWDYTPPQPPGAGHEPPTLKFRAIPASLPPSNVHALIGRNGVGKTSMMRAMADGVASGSIEVRQLTIVFCLAGQLDVMVYEHLKWDARKLGLLTLTPGQCAWLSRDNYAVHRVYCPMDGGGGKTGPGYMNSTADFGASFHVYLNPDQSVVHDKDGDSYNRNSFDYIDEKSKNRGAFATESDLSWNILRRVLANTPLT